MKGHDEDTWGIYLRSTTMCGRPEGRRRLLCVNRWDRWVELSRVEGKEQRVEV